MASNSLQPEEKAPPPVFPPIPSNSDETFYTTLGQFMAEQPGKSLRKSLPTFEPPEDYLDRIYERIKRLPRIYSDVRAEHSMVVFEETASALNRMPNKQDRVKAGFCLYYIHKPFFENLKSYCSYLFSSGGHYNFFYIIIGDENPEVTIEGLCAYLKKMFHYYKREEIEAKNFGLATDGDYWYLATYDGAKKAEVCLIIENFGNN